MNAFKAQCSSAIPSVAFGQFIYLDFNQDQVCDGGFLPGDRPADIYLDTAHNSDGSDTRCVTGEALSLYSYDILLHADCGGLTVQSWENAVPGFVTTTIQVENGEYLRISAGATPASALPPGRYRLGTLNFAYTPPLGSCPGLQFTAARTVAGVTSWTGFGTTCPGPYGDYISRLGVDFFDACAAGSICDPPYTGYNPQETFCSTNATDGTTWGRIKKIYR